MSPASIHLTQALIPPALQALDKLLRDSTKADGERG